MKYVLILFYHNIVILAQTSQRGSCQHCNALVASLPTDVGGTGFLSRELCIFVVVFLGVLLAFGPVYLVFGPVYLEAVVSILVGSLCTSQPTKVCVTQSS